MWAAAFALDLLLNSDHLLTTGYEQLSYFQLNINKKFNQILSTCKPKCLRFNTTLKLKAIHGHTHRNKTKKPCWWQLPMSKTLLQYGRGDKNSHEFYFEILLKRIFFQSIHLCITLITLALIYSLRDCCFVNLRANASRLLEIFSFRIRTWIVRWHNSDISIL